MIGNNRYYRRMINNVSSGFIYLSAGFIRRTFLSDMLELIYRLQDGMISNNHTTDDVYKDDRIYQPVLNRNMGKLEADYQERLEHVQDEYGSGSTKLIIQGIIDNMLSVTSTSTTMNILKVMRK